MHIPITIHKLIDQYNYPLWDRLQKEYTIIYSMQGHKYLSCEVRGNIIEFKLPFGSLCYNQFTFILGRLHLTLIKKILIKEYLLILYREKPLIQWSFNSDNLFDQIGTHLENSKISILLSKLGIAVKENQERDENKLTLTSTLLQNPFAGHKINPATADLFIHTYFLASCSNIKSETKFTYHVNLLRISPELYSIPETFYSAWHQFDIEKYHVENNCYRGFTKLFMESLCTWANKNVDLGRTQR